MQNITSSPSWTNPSVLQLAGEADPIATIVDKARSLVLEATDRGWSGPPFDPVALCKLLSLEAVAREDIADARTVPTGNKTVRIEFNPLRPRGRARFSVAHEIAHTLFPDCAEEVRNRAQRADMRGDQWQLEMLCNIAASEIVMPAGHFPNLKGESLDVNHLMELRRQYDVSTEALFLRVVRLSDIDCTMFAVARDEGDAALPTYRVHYSMPSRNASVPLRRGMKLPVDSVVRECTAIGFTAKGTENWDAIGEVRVQTVGVPSYPGSRFPRVIGLIQPLDEGASENAFGISYLHGDVLQPRGVGPHVVAHIVNDRTPNWGGGFARAVASKFPNVQDEFHAWSHEDPKALTLGNTHFSAANESLMICSMVAQHGLGQSTSPRIRYNALGRCLEVLAARARELGASIHLPRIGTGNAGGDWGVISSLIDEIVCADRVPVTVYDLPGAPKPQEGLFGG